MEVFVDDFNRKRHAVYKLTYHAVFVIKYRRKVMSEPIIKHIRQYVSHLIEQCYQGKLIELNGMRLRISSGRIVSGQTVISLPLQEVQTSKH